MVAFLEALTDEKVRNEEGVFSHPSLPISLGHEGDEDMTLATFAGISNDEFVTLPAVGANGRAADNLPPLPSFEEMLECVNGDPDGSVPCFQSKYGAN